MNSRTHSRTRQCYLCSSCSPLSPKLFDTRGSLLSPPLFKAWLFPPLPLYVFLYSRHSYFPPPNVYFSIQRWIFLQALCPHVRSCCAVKLLMLLWFVAQVFTFDKNLSFQRLEQQGLAAKRHPFGITYMGPLRSEES